MIAYAFDPVSGPLCRDYLPSPLVNAILTILTVAMSKRGEAGPYNAADEFHEHNSRHVTYSFILKCSAQ